MKLVRKRIDTDGLTKVSDQITFRMLQKERAYKQKIETLNEQMRRMERFVYALMHINQNQVNRNNTHSSAMKEIFSSFLAYSCASGNNIAE